MRHRGRQRCGGILLLREGAEFSSIDCNGEDRLKSKGAAWALEAPSTIPDYRLSKSVQVCRAVVKLDS